MNMVKYLSTLRLVPPTAVTSLLAGSWSIQILKTAVEVGIFEALAEGPRNTVAVAEGLGLDVKGAGLLLDALVGLKFLNRADLSGSARSIEPVYELNMISQSYLLKSSPLFMGLYLEHHFKLDQVWQKLTEAIASGKPVMEVNEDAKAEEIFPHLAEALVPLNYGYAADACKEVLAKRPPGGLRVLDVAAGSAVWSIPFAQASRETKVDALDFPAVLEVTSKVTGAFGVGGQYSQIAGNWRQAKLEDEIYDVIILGHILHSEGAAASRELLGLCYRTMKSGGTLVIAEFMPNQERTAPPQPLLFAVNMYLATTSGCVFSFEELSSICRAVGFKDVYRHQGVEYDSPVVLAGK